MPSVEITEARQAIPRQTEDEQLREGIKYMLALATTSLVVYAQRENDEEFTMAEDIIVDRFIDGLRANGYDIVKYEAS